VLLSIPSPGDPFVFHLGGLQPRWYGLLLAAAVAAAVWMTRRRFRACGLDPERVDQVLTEPGAHTIGLDSERHRVYAFLPLSHRAAVFADDG